MIALVDCNSFYASCERVFDARARRQPVAVLSNNDGCIVACSKEVKELGIPTGAPYFKFKHIIRKHKIRVFSSNYTLYGDLSNRVMKTLSEFSPKIEIYSIDEAFLDFSGFNRKELPSYIKNIKETVYKETGIPVSIGLSHTKVLSKILNNEAKKKNLGSLALFKEEDLNQVLKNTSVADIWGIGRKMNVKLHELKLRTAYDLKIYENDLLIKKKLTTLGRRIQEELRGVSCVEIHDITQERKNILSSRSFGKKVSNIRELKEAVASHVTTASEKLRKQKSTAQYISVFIKTNRFSDTLQTYDSKGFSFISPTQSTFKLITAAMNLVDQIYKKGFLYQKCGVLLAGLYPEKQSQFDLFSENDSEKEITIMKTMDSINKFHGNETLKVATCGIDKHWRMLSRMKSPAYTTRLSELLEVK